MFIGNFGEFPTVMESFLGSQKNWEIAGKKLDQREGLVMHDPLILKD